MHTGPTSVVRRGQILPALSQWQSFRDAEVLSFALVRGSRGNDFQSCAALVLRLKDPHTAELRVDIELHFHDLEALVIGDFDHLNSVETITVTILDRLRKYKVVVDAIAGFSGSWVCRDAFVAEVREHTEDI